MCRVMGVSRSGWYAQRRRPAPSARELADRALERDIERVHATSRGTYGAIRVQKQLARDGIQVGRRRVARLMQRRGLCGKVRRRFVRTTDSAHRHPIAPNVLNQRFDVDQADRVWSCDITYIPTAEGMGQQT